MYYSTGILSAVMPNSAEWISLIIAIINAAMTFPTVILIEVSCILKCFGDSHHVMRYNKRLGRLPLLRYSAYGSIVSLVLAGIGIDFSIPLLASLAVISFVA